MHAVDATRLTMRSYPGGIAAIALRMGRSASSLEKETRCQSGHKMGLLDALEVMQLAREARSDCALAPLNALADALGCMVLELSAQDAADAPVGAPVVVDVAALMRECAELVAEALDADADRLITRNELARLERSWGDVVAAGQAMLLRLRARHEAGKPVSERGRV